MKRTTLAIDGYDFSFDDALLQEYAEKMGDDLYDVIILKSDIIAFAPTVKEAVETFGIEELTKMAEERIRFQLSTF